MNKHHSVHGRFLSIFACTVVIASASLSGCSHGSGSIVPAAAPAPLTAGRNPLALGAAVVAINVAGPATGKFTADADGAGGQPVSTGDAIDASAPNAAPAEVYQTQRFGAMTYTIPNLAAGASYTARLHFAEIYFGLAGRQGPGARQFNVSVNGTRVLSNFDIFTAAGGADKGLAVDFPTAASSNGQIVISLTNGATNAPALNGIEVLTPTNAIRATAIHVGGPATGSFNADMDGVGGIVSTTADVIDTTTANSAPSALYQSQRYGPMTYTVPGFTPGAGYTVRLHFSEMYWGADGRPGGAGSRKFNVAINGTNALTNLDVFTKAGGPNKAVVIDVPASADGSGTFTISLTNGSADNAMLNGIEILGGANGTPQPVNVGGEAPRPSDAIVDVIGVNTHLSNFSVFYGQNFPAVKSLLQQAGIRHIRDGAPGGNASLCANEASLASSGIRLSGVTDGNLSDLATSISCLGSTIESIEGVNEADLNNDPGWVSYLRGNTQAIASQFPQFPIIAPSVTTVSAELSLGSMESVVTFGNAHAYFAGRNPGTYGWGAQFPYGVYGSLTYNLGVAAVVSGNKPVDITETGYSEDASDQYHMPAVTKARYTLRTFLEAFNAGVPRVYVYELIDEGPAPFSHYGIVDASGRPKLAYTAIGNFIHHVSDPGGPFGVTPLSYTLTAPSTVHHSLLQRRNGTFQLVIWNEVAEWDPNAYTTISTTPQSVQLSFAYAPASLQQTTFSDDGTLSTVALTSAQTITVNASAWPVIVDIRP